MCDKYKVTCKSMTAHKPGVCWVCKLYHRKQAAISSVSMSPGLLPSPVYPKFVWLQKDKTQPLRLVFKLQNINMQHTPGFCQDTWTSGKEACWKLEASLAQCWANASKFLSSTQFFQIVFLSLRDEAIWRPASMFISFVTCHRCKSNFLNRISPRNYIADWPWLVGRCQIYLELPQR